MCCLFILLSFCFLSIGHGLKPSAGCGRAFPPHPKPGFHHRFHVNYHDKGLGVVDRNYFLQIPGGKFLNQSDLM